MTKIGHSDKQLMNCNQIILLLLIHVRGTASGDNLPATTKEDLDRLFSLGYIDNVVSIAGNPPIATARYSYTADITPKGRTWIDAVKRLSIDTQQIFVPTFLLESEKIGN